MFIESSVVVCLTNKDFIRYLPELSKHFILYASDSANQMMARGFIKSLPYNLREQVWQFISKVNMPDDLYNYLAESFFDDVAAKPILPESATNDQVNSFRHVLLSAAEAGIARSYFNSNAGLLKRDEAQRLLKLDFDPEVNVLLHNNFHNNFGRVQQYNLNLVTNNDFDSAVSLRNFMISAKFNTVLDGSRSPYFGKLNGDLVYHISTFLVAEDSLGLDFINTLEKQDKFLASDYRMTKESEESFKPSTLSRLNMGLHKIQQSVTSEHVFSFIVSLYFASLLMMFKLPQLLWLPVVFCCLAFFVINCFNNPSYMNAMIKFLKYDLGAQASFLINFIAVSLFTTFVLLHMNVLLFIPLLLICLTEVRPFISFLVGDVTGKDYSNSVYNEASIEANSFLAKVSFTEVEANQQQETSGMNTEFNPGL